MSDEPVEEDTQDDTQEIEIDFGDIDPDDSVDEGDEATDWSSVDAVQEQVDAINAIEDDDERVAAAQRWSRELAGEEF
jgi:hypothetical protein